MSVLNRSDDWRSEIRAQIMESAQLNGGYLFMNVLAATIATSGLLAGSPSGVIGAMIVAMLFGPISGVALSLVDGNKAGLFRSSLALLAGAVVVLATSLVLGIVFRESPLTAEIMARTSPNVLDLLVALGGGAAGAYAVVSPNKQTALVGVAISTALVPPLCAGSILLGRGEFYLASQAVLLTFTNVVAIQVAFAATLWYFGFRRLHTGGATMSVYEFARSAPISLVTLIALAVVLTWNLQDVIRREAYKSAVQQHLQDRCELLSPHMSLVNTTFERRGGRWKIDAVLRGPAVPSTNDVRELRADIAKLSSRPPDITFHFVETTLLDDSQSTVTVMDAPRKSGSGS